MPFLPLIKYVSLVEKAQKNSIIYDEFQMLVVSISLDRILLGAQEFKTSRELRLFMFSEDKALSFPAKSSITNM